MWMQIVYISIKKKKCLYLGNDKSTLKLHLKGYLSYSEIHEK